MDALLYYGYATSPELPPLEVDGYEWYPVEHAPGYAGWPLAPADEDRDVGYVAVRSAAEWFVELVEPECPDAVGDLGDVVALTPYERVACLGDRTLTLEGTFGCPFCHSLAHPNVVAPAWLAEWSLHLSMLVPSWEVYPPFPGSIVLATPPELPNLYPDQLGSILRVTGHFDDPRSAECSISEEPGGPSIHPESVEWYCRARFVVDTWGVIGTDPAYAPLRDRGAAR